jgi:hypothetical protein
MTIEPLPTDDAEKKMEMKFQGGASDSVYGLGMIGAWVYYIGRAGSLREGVLGFLKGLVWPAFLVYELLDYLHKE